MREPMYQPCCVPSTYESAKAIREDNEVIRTTSELDLPDSSGEVVYRGARYILMINAYQYNALPRVAERVWL